MSHPRRTMTDLIASITGDVIDQEMVKVKDGNRYGGPALEAGGRIVLGTATTVKVLVEDQNGVVLHSAAAAVTANVDIEPIPQGVKLPLLVTTTEISDAAHTLTVYWSIKK
jgi:hypothetical protein